MKGLHSRIVIAAPPEAIWTALIDAGAHAAWNGDVDRIEGNVRPGARLRVRSTTRPERALTVSVTFADEPRILELTHRRRLGLHRTIVTVELVPRRDGSTSADFRQEYRGALAALRRRMPTPPISIGPLTRDLRYHVEQQSHARSPDQA